MAIPFGRTVSRFLFWQFDQGERVGFERERERERALLEWAQFPLRKCGGFAERFYLRDRRGWRAAHFFVGRKRRAVFFVDDGYPRRTSCYLPFEMQDQRLRRSGFFR